MPDDVTQIKIGNHRIGIIGLEKACQRLSEKSAHLPDAEIKQFLMAELKKTNYIPETAAKAYETAFFNAFMAYVGKPVAGVSSGTGIEIKILGQGCVRCNQLEADVMNLMAEAEIDADIIYVKDIKEIAAHGVLGLPGLVINGKVMSAGTLPSMAKILGWVRAALAEAG